jgi:hypothetical protein
MRLEAERGIKLSLNYLESNPVAWQRGIISNGVKSLEISEIREAGF